MRIPREIRLPFGYRIAVKEVSDATLREEAECSEDEGTPDGLWDEEARTIYIKTGIGVKRAKYILVHEIAHSIFDWQHSLLDSGVIKP